MSEMFFSLCSAAFNLAMKFGFVERGSAFVLNCRLLLYPIEIKQLTGVRVEHSKSVSRCSFCN